MFASEYAWSREYTLDMPIDQIPQLIHAVLYRKGVRVLRKTPSMDIPTIPLSERVKHVLTQSQE